MSWETFPLGEEQSEVCSGEWEVGKKKKGEKKTETFFGANWTRQNRTEQNDPGFFFLSFSSSLFFLLQGGGDGDEGRTKQNKTKEEKETKSGRRGGGDGGHPVITGCGGCNGEKAVR